MRCSRRVIVLPDAAALTAAAARRCLEHARRAIAARGAFHVALSGGSTPRLLYENLAADPDADWSRWHVWFGDERCVGQDQPDSNYRMARETLLDRVSIPVTQIHPMYQDGDPASAASAYVAALKAGLSCVNGFPVLDLVILGMGEDGHTASLFPGRPANDERVHPVSTCTAPNGSDRITLTPPAIGAAREVIVLVSGVAKAGVLARILADEAPDLPIARIGPNGGFEWFVDAAARGQG